MPISVEHPLFSNISTRIFSDEGGIIRIGGQEVSNDVLGVLKDQARNLETSQLYEVFLATLRNEAFNLSLIQSKDWDAVQFAKALYYCTRVIEDMISSLKAK